VSSIVMQREIRAGAKRILVVHGDLINDRDYAYHFWRKFSKNPLMRFAVKLIPKGIARGIVDGMERKLARTNFKHRYRLPTEAMEAYGRSRAADGFDMVIFGHFHKKLELPAGSALVAVLPAWFDDGEAIVVNPETGEWKWMVV
jgi:UDP-2,3-diacylglucosamine pyrophosphatase LpxH